MCAPSCAGAAGRSAWAGSSPPRLPGTQAAGHVHGHSLALRPPDAVTRPTPIRSRVLAETPTSCLSDCGGGGGGPQGLRVLVTAVILGRLPLPCSGLDSRAGCRRERGQAGPRQLFRGHVRGAGQSCVRGGWFVKVRTGRESGLGALPVPANPGSPLHCRTSQRGTLSPLHATPLLCFAAVTARRGCGLCFVTQRL